MAKIIDLNALEQPTLEVKMSDDNKTLFRLTYPTEKLVERFISAAGTLKSTKKLTDSKQLDALYNLLADVMSCNVDNIEVTAEELRGKYRVGFAGLLAIYQGYLGFLNELNEAKN